MPFSRPAARGTAARRTLWEGLALILIPALALGVVEIYQVMAINPDLRKSQDAISHTIEVITAVQAMERGLREAENGERDFVITGNPAWLAAYASGAGAARAALADARQLTLDNPEQQARWPRLQREVSTRLDLLDRTIEARRSGGIAAARAVVESNAGSDNLANTDRLIDAAIATENALLRKRRASSSAANGINSTADLIAGGIALIIIVAGGALLAGTFRRMQADARELAASDERVRGLIEAAPDAMVIVDCRGLIALVNEQTEKLFGYTRRELVGDRLEKLLPPRLRERHGRLRPDYFQDPRPRVMGRGLDLCGLRRDGSEFPIEVSLSPYESPTELFVCASIRDISERRQAEAELAREREERESTEAKLRQAQKMEALGQLTGGIAHDFNNMLGVIIGSLELLRSRLDGHADKRHSDPIRFAIEAAERCSALTRRLLAFSRQQPLEPRPLDCNRLVSGMSNLLRRTLGETISVETVQAGGLWAAQADVNQLENALLNLALNARDAMRDGGKLTIETANAFLDEAYAAAVHDVVEPGQYVLIAVSDTGVGMNEATVARAFEPFFSTKEAGQGTGLGLSQVYGFIKQSNGHIRIYSEEGAGTSVKLYLPRAVGVRAEAADERWPEAMEPADAHGTILMVEDNELLLESVATMLREHGYRVLVAEDATGALALLATEPAVGLLFTDVGLPGGVNGRQLAEEVRRFRPEVKILFTTGYTRNAIIHHGRLDPDIEFIGKPFTFKALVNKIERLLAERV